MRRIVGAALVCVLCVPPATATGVGITPTRLDLGTHSPGDTFYGDFHVLAVGNASVSVDFSTTPASLSTFRRIDVGDPGSFSAQPCPGCITFLRGEGQIRERDRRIKNTARWNTARFLVQLPPDIEPGIHVLMITPRPEVSGDGGGVGMVSTTSLPVVFRVPGESHRSGLLLGVRRGDIAGAVRELVARFHNNGTATMSVSTRFRLSDENGSISVPAGTKTVPPGGTASFTASAPRDTVNGSTITAIADYGTGSATATAAGTEPVSREHVDADRIVLMLLLAFTTIATWAVIRRG